MKLTLDGVKRYTEFTVEKDITLNTKIIEDDTGVSEHLTLTLKSNEGEEVMTSIVDLYYGSEKELKDGIDTDLTLTREQEQIVKKKLQKNANLFAFFFMPEKEASVFDYINLKDFTQIICEAYDYSVSKCVVNIKRY